jgi:hypothetical protein
MGLNHDPSFAPSWHTFIEIPSPLRKLAMMNPPLSDLCGEYRAESVSPKPDSFVTDINATLEQNILDLP